MRYRSTEARAAYALNTILYLFTPSLFITGLTEVLEREGWEVHTQLGDPDHLGPPLQEFKGSQKELDAETLRRLRNPEPDYCDHKRALILKTSHIGGHKFAGNCIVSVELALTRLMEADIHLSEDQLSPRRVSVVWTSYTS